MKKSRFTEAQIVGILKEAENGLPMADLLRSHGVIPSIFGTYSVRPKRPRTISSCDTENSPK